MKRLPDSEFAVLKIIWRLGEPITSARIMEQLEHDKDWKPQTLLTILARLTEKGFLKSVRVGRERHYTVLIGEEEYMAVETKDFLSRFRNNSLGHLVKTLFQQQDLSDADLAELKTILQEKGGE